MAEETSAVMKVTAKQNVGFYMRAAASFLRGTNDKKPVEELTLTALGQAIGIVATVAGRIEKEGLATITSVKTFYADVPSGQGGESTRGCAQLQVVLKNSSK
eukprot:TRINITY_DN93222_c0_g1_i1.p1 TRINITY_DN93222_c0_g1~~TRINITY_DN93222_c0_g1_i1.p1  ORF type:complete len:102 (-),score=24.69 TRINITY_DN93222_c0_g1_i1:185-490(-)